MTAQKMYDWIVARLTEGRTVYATNYLTVIKIAPKHRETVRLRGNHVEVQRGKRWDSIIYCKITAI